MSELIQGGDFLIEIVRDDIHVDIMVKKSMGSVGVDIVKGLRGRGVKGLGEQLVCTIPVHGPVRPHLATDPRRSGRCPG